MVIVFCACVQCVSGVGVLWFGLQNKGTIFLQVLLDSGGAVATQTDLSNYTDNAHYNVTLFHKI